MGIVRTGCGTNFGDLGIVGSDFSATLGSICENEANVGRNSSGSSSSRSSRPESSNCSSKTSSKVTAAWVVAVDDVVAAVVVVVSEGGAVGSSDLIPNRRRSSGMLVTRIKGKRLRLQYCVNQIYFTPKYFRN